MEIKIEKHTRQFLEDHKISEWDVWKGRVSRFNWNYDETEKCYLLTGRVDVETKDRKVAFGAEDFVTFPKGLSCIWDIKQPVRMHIWKNTYGPHDNPALQKLFRAKPWQGQKPEDADIIFLALDANYSRDVDVTLIKKYHENGVCFWNKNNVHHPFLTSQYTGSDGRKFHETFAIMGLDSSFAEYLSFVELLHYPTKGSRKGKKVDYSLEHLRWVDCIIRKAKITFILSGLTSGVYPEMIKLRKRHDIFEWLPDSLQDSEHVPPVLYKTELTTIYKPYHFSCQGKEYTTLIDKQLPEMSNIIKSYVKHG
jgi:uncharacterized cupin superfamily protein